MKKNIITICLAVVGAMLASCDDLLDKQPLHQLNADNYWKTEKDVQAALAATYTQYRTNLAGSVPGSNGVSFAIDCLSDDAISRSGYFNIQTIMHGGINPQTGGAVQDIWEICYDGIAQCNFFLDHLDLAKPVLNQAAYDKYKGEALFNRAFFYNELVQFYGAVPLILSFPKIEDVDILKTLPRVPKAEVVSQILQDLDIAIAGLPNVNFTDGHAVRGSAIMLKVRVLMNNKMWTEAADAAWALIGDPANPFRLHNNYSGIFFGEQKGNKEIMFAVQYQAPSDAHQLDQYVGSRMSFFPTTQLRDAYEVKDPVTGEKDPRLSMTIFREGDPWVNHVDGIFTTKSTGRLSESNVPFTKLAFKKWINPALVEARGNISDQHIVKMRYAELLLAYAEAMVESGQAADARALAAINQVRQREGVEMPPLAALTVDNVRKERRVELAFEGLRYNDLIRWGIAHEILPNIPGNGANVKRTFTMTNYVWPIPQSQMDIMLGIWNQNDGY